MAEQTQPKFHHRLRVYVQQNVWDSFIARIKKQNKKTYPPEWENKDENGLIAFDVAFYSNNDNQFYFKKYAKLFLDQVKDMTEHIRFCKTTQQASVFCLTGVPTTEEELSREAFYQQLSTVKKLNRN